MSLLLGGEGAYARDKNTSARLCVKNAGGGLYTRGGVFAGHYKCRPNLVCSLLCFLYILSLQDKLDNPHLLGRILLQGE